MVRRKLLAPLTAVLLLVASACGGGEDAGREPGPGPCDGAADCGWPFPFCVDGTCAACVNHSHCEASAPACVDGGCTACTSDAHCEGRAELPRCESETGACVACLSDDDCAGSLPRCDHGGRCVACLADAECPGGAACNDGVCDKPPGCFTGEDCQPDELCLIPAGALQGVCEEACDVRLGGPCDGLERCALVDFGPGPEFEPIGACLPPNGGAGAGEGCGEGLAFCETALLCIEWGSGAEAGTCVAPCDEADPTSCADPELECTVVSVEQPAGAELGVCLPRGLDCSTDADCREEEACAIVGGGGGRIELGCIPAGGVKRGGEACTADAECASAFCVAGVCFGACEERTDCREGTGCVDVAFNLGDGTYDAVPLCLESCLDDAACGDARTCLPWQSHDRTSLMTVCLPARGSGGPGDACLRDESCRTGQCNEGAPRGFCMGICDDDEDCGPNTSCRVASYFLGSGADGRSGTPDDLYGFTRSCTGAPCASDTDCADTGWACSPMAGGATQGRMELRCHPNPGEKRGGEACTDGIECRSGRCFDPTQPGEDCYDGVDNDGNGLVDCDDLACLELCHTEWSCGNGLDDDGDGAIDCADGDCLTACEYESNCGNGIDDDGDNLIDCADPDCRYACNLVEIDCANGADDDGDGLVDCADPDCRYQLGCRETECDDGEDDDGDGYVDCQDPDCRWIAPCNTRVAEGEANPAQCENGIDDDADGLVDCDDPSCDGRGACAEAGCATGSCCQNGIDDDGDGLVDCADPDCSSAAGCFEFDCTDGIDNDGDGPVDCKDPDCANDPVCNERNCRTGDCCSNGIDDDGDGGIDCVDAQCRYTAACDEQYCTSGNCCGDGEDNDGDGLVDCADPNCRYSSSCRETACTDGADNDGDGAIDCHDADCHSHSSCRALWYVCFEACAVDADCAVGNTCVPAAAGFAVPGRRDYFPACL